MKSTNLVYIGQIFIIIIINKTNQYQCACYKIFCQKIQQQQQQQEKHITTNT
jgi:hypothetical protein